MYVRLLREDADFAPAGQRASEQLEAFLDEAKPRKSREPPNYSG
jgi:hypothetical protein